MFQIKHLLRFTLSITLAILIYSLCFADPELYPFSWNHLPGPVKTITIYTSNNCNDIPEHISAYEFSSELSEAIECWNVEAVNISIIEANGQQYTPGIQDDTNWLNCAEGINPEQPNWIAQTWVYGDPEYPLDITEADNVLWDGYYYNNYIPIWTLDPVNPPSWPPIEQFRPKAAALHELGHLLGLMDVTSGESVMKVPYSPEQIYTSLTDYDKTAVKTMYNFTALNPEEPLKTGQPYTFSWTNLPGADLDFIDNVYVYINREFPAGVWEKFGLSTPARYEHKNLGTIKGNVSDNCRFKVQSVDHPQIYDITDENFSVFGYFPYEPEMGWTW